MQSPLQIKDFLDFEDLFIVLSKEVTNKKAREKLTSEDLVQAF
jgi:hypothetical protein